MPSIASARDWHGALLRVRGERPCSSRATEQGDELAPF
jgi:hypothetical protein